MGYHEKEWRLLLVRHAESCANIGVPAPGFHPDDPPLSEAGLEQARRLAARFAPGEIDRIFASTLIRTCQTADPSAEKLGVPITVLPQLMEVDIAVPGTSLSHVARLAPNALESAGAALPQAVPVKPETGEETPSHCIARAKQALAVIYEQTPPNGSALVVSHAAFFGYLLREALGISLPEPFHWQVDNCALTEIAFPCGGAPLLRRANDTSHFYL